MNRVTISVHGGSVAVEELPEDMEVEVKDYDVEAYDDDDDRIMVDEEGQRFVRRQFRAA